jgi:hypothetical protein
MCAAGSQEMTFAPSGNRTICSMLLTAASRLRCSSWTPLGGPVVPEV